MVAFSWPRERAECSGDATLLVDSWGGMDRAFDEQKDLQKSTHRHMRSVVEVEASLSALGR